MTAHEVSVLLDFLTGGLLVGALGGWLDQLVAYIRKR